MDDTRSERDFFESNIFLNNENDLFDEMKNRDG